MSGHYNYSNFREWMYKRIDEETGKFSEEFIAGVEQFMTFANSQSLTQSNGANELHRLCSQPFTCGNQNGLLYPFWTSERKDCGHPDFELNCSSGFAELSISSVKFRILEANYESRFIRLARSDYIGDLCPKDPLNVPFDESVLPLVPNTTQLTIYYDCNQDFSGYVSTYVRALACDDGDGKGNYYVTRNLSSPLLQGSRGVFNDFRVFCDKNVSIPANGPALTTLQTSSSRDNLKKALEEGFELGLNQECSRCLALQGACGYNRTSSTFTCYYIVEPNDRTRKKGVSPGAIAGIEYASGSVAIILIAGGLFCLISQRRKTSEVPRQLNLKALIPLEHYSYAQVKRITKSFAEVIGKGGFGTVYRGTLCDGRKVAVKVLNDTTGNGEDFVNEVASMSKTSHVNIVTLLGFCAEGTKRAILYEFLENGSLDKFISSKRSSDMDWTELYGIALGVARGLEYLHHGCRTRIVHFDIKPQNVLLDGNLCPKVSDFGLAKLCERKESILSLLDTRGTIGYIAPEVFSRVYGRVSHKSDVYSYGMLVLEMIGARNKTSTGDTASSASSVYFPEWIYKDLEKGHSGTPTGDGISNEEEEIAKKMTLVGLWCVQYSPSDRPSMNRVVEMMEGSLDALEVPPRPVLQIPTAPLPESSTVSEDISVYTEVCSLNIA
ncbi:LEAF RUST 10 DISEASE-RESISTANCE LOCUS RECEPTOR-LIKE PROTEIN KINASE-like 2.5 isoform X2 [Raphanus sativus]|uniref:non-specific serine/threonine protein kinase n=1 Tax=Raphanus sativus TaxID=3726 RepID=A0A9W3CM90_RAPSA|nr:LEAF RUST 10 DISEASE-RESISTANCE LOCUS RECEPTOR-LIKE PROTEIN KINASE-like 2.5 isoform X2 [Raphanus sativus]